MRKLLMALIWTTLIVLIIPNVVFARYNAPISHQEFNLMLDDMKSKTVKIHNTHPNAPNGYVAGTGWLIEGDYVITGSHVVNVPQAKLYNIMLNDSNHTFFFDFEVVKDIPEQDIAIIKLNVKYDWERSALDEVGYFKFADSVTVGEPVMSLGYPLEIDMDDLSYSEGCVVSVDVGVDWVGTPITSRQIKFYLESKKGNSGGPIFNARGEIVSMMVGVETNNSNNSYGVKLSDLRSAVENISNAIVASVK